MAWVLLAGLALVLVLRFARRRRATFSVLPFESNPTLHVVMPKGRTARTRAALEAATAALC